VNDPAGNSAEWSADRSHTGVENPVEKMCLECLNVDEFLDQIRNYLQPKISAESFNNWLHGTEFVAVDGNTLVVSVPDASTRSWLETEYAGMVKGGIRDLHLPVVGISYEVRASRAAQNPPFPVATRWKNLRLLCLTQGLRSNPS